MTRIIHFPRMVHLQNPSTRSCPLTISQQPHPHIPSAATESLHTPPVCTASEARLAVLGVWVMGTGAGSISSNIIPNSAPTLQEHLLDHAPRILLRVLETMSLGGGFPPHLVHLGPTENLPPANVPT